MRGWEVSKLRRGWSAFADHDGGEGVGVWLRVGLGLGLGLGWFCGEGGVGK